MNKGPCVLIRTIMEESVDGECVVDGGGRSFEGDRRWLKQLRGGK